MSVASCLSVISSLWLCVHYIIPGAAGPLLWGEPQDMCCGSMHCLQSAVCVGPTLQATRGTARVLFNCRVQEGNGIKQLNNTFIYPTFL